MGAELGYAGTSIKARALIGADKLHYSLWESKSRCSCLEIMSVTGLLEFWVCLAHLRLHLIATLIWKGGSNPSHPQTNACAGILGAADDADIRYSTGSVSESLFYFLFAAVSEWATHSPAASVCALSLCHSTPPLSPPSPPGNTIYGSTIRRLAAWLQRQFCCWSSIHM